jgi:hypothetical protein
LCSRFSCSLDDAKLLVLVLSELMNKTCTRPFAITGRKKTMFHAPQVTERKKETSSCLCFNTYTKSYSLHLITNLLQQYFKKKLYKDPTKKRLCIGVCKLLSFPPNSRSKYSSLSWYLGHGRPLIKKVTSPRNCTTYKICLYLSWIRCFSLLYLWCTNSWVLLSIPTTSTWQLKEHIRASRKSIMNMFNES